MIFIKSVRSFLKIFYLLGLSPFNGEIRSKKEGFAVSDVYKYISLIVSWILSISCIYILFTDPIAEGLTPADTYIFLLSFICEIFRSTILFMQCVIQKKKFIEINYGFQKIASYFYIHLQHIIPYRTFRRKFIVRILIVSSAYIQYLLRHLFRNRNYFGFSSRLRILQVLTVCTFLQIIFYVDNLTFHIKQLNVVIGKELVRKKSIFTGNSNSVGNRQKLKTIKVLHYRIWSVAQNINSLFGWSLIALILNGFLDFIYCAYWVYEELHSRSGFTYVISMDVEYNSRTVRLDIF